MTIELTNKDLEKLAKSLRGDGWLCRSGPYDPETRLVDTVDGDAVANAFDELLNLRKSRDTGDEHNLRFREHLEQVDDWIGKVPVAHLETVYERDARITLSKMEEMYITRGQQLREALEEVERLKGYITVLNGGGPPNE